MPFKKHFILSFFAFLGFFALQAIDSQELAGPEPLQKKSCLKTSRRFFDFRELWHNHRHEYENDEIMGRNKEKMGRWNKIPGLPETPDELNG